MRQDQEISLAEYRALAEFRFAIRRFIRFSEQAARAVGIEPQQYQLLLTLRGIPKDRDPTIGTLAERLQLQHHSTVELIDRSERHGLVARRRSEADRRQVFISLTPHGEEVLRELAVHHRDELRTAAPALVRALNALAGGLEASPATHGPPDRALSVPTERE